MAFKKTKMQRTGTFRIIASALLLVAFGYLLWFRLTTPVATMGTAQPTSDFKQGASFLDLAMALLENGHLTEAISLLRKDRLLHPQSLTTLYFLGKAYQKKRAVSQAIETLHHLVALDSSESSPWSLYALEDLGELYARNDQLERARQAYSRAMKRETRKEWIVKIKNQLAELDLTEGRYRDDGNTNFNHRGEVIDGVGPGDMRTNRNFEIARHTTDWKKKAIYFRKAIETDPGMYQAYFNTGLALIKQNKLKEAIPYFQKSNAVWQSRRDVNPQGREKCSALAYLGFCYLALGDYDQALRYCSEAIKIDPDYYYAHLFKARVLLKLHRSEEAAKILAYLLQNNPDEIEILKLLSEAYRQMGQQSLAMVALRQAEAVKYDLQLINFKEASAGDPRPARVNRQKSLGY